MTTPTQAHPHDTEQSTRDCGNTADLKPAAVSPTQAQIVDAAQDFDYTRYLQTEIAKLRTALKFYAEASDYNKAIDCGKRIDPYAGMQRNINGLVLKYTDKDLHDTEAATIERCAQVAENFRETDPYQILVDIAAAIRALKDKA